MRQLGTVLNRLQVNYALQRVRKNRTNFYSGVWVKTGARRHASLGNGSETASSELRVATRHIVN